MTPISKTLGICVITSFALSSLIGRSVYAREPSRGSGDGIIRSALLGCAPILAALDSTTAGVTCVESADLTTANPATTPANNSIPGIPLGAFTPVADRAGQAPANPAFRTPLRRAVPGLQISGRMTDRPGSRWVVRLPNEWNGRLVTGVASGTRSEYAGDWVHSDYLVQQGYAYVGTNKGSLNQRPGSATDPKACRTSPNSSTLVNVYQTDEFNPSLRSDATLTHTKIARSLASANYGSAPTRTYIVGVSSGALVVRRVLEQNPEAFDGGIDWESPWQSDRQDNG